MTMKEITAADMKTRLGAAYANIHNWLAGVVAIARRDGQQLEQLTGDASFAKAPEEVQRVLDLCAHPDDRHALCTLLLIHAGYVVQNQKAPPSPDDVKRGEPS